MGAAARVSEALTEAGFDGGAAAAGAVPAGAVVAGAGAEAEGTSGDGGGAPPESG